jgi:hypothetical protein
MSPHGPAGVNLRDIDRVQRLLARLLDDIAQTGQQAADILRLHWRHGAASFVRRRCITAGDTCSSREFCGCVLGHHAGSPCRAPFSA